jgi:predicted thioesterase
MLSKMTMQKNIGGILMEHKITVGLSTIHKREGTIRGTYTYSGSNDSLDYLLSTPEVLDIIIEASTKMLDPLLPAGYITIGKYIELSHEQPTLTLTGGTISTILTVTEISGNKIYLDFSCHDEIGLICRGLYERAIVDREKLMESTYRRAQSKM